MKEPLATRVILWCPINPLCIAAFYKFIISNDIRMKFLDSWPNIDSPLTSNRAIIDEIQIFEGLAIATRRCDCLIGLLQSQG